MSALKCNLGSYWRSFILALFGHLWPLCRKTRPIIIRATSVSQCASQSWALSCFLWTPVWLACLLQLQTKKKLQHSHAALLETRFSFSLPGWWASQEWVRVKAFHSSSEGVCRYNACVAVARINMHCTMLKSANGLSGTLHNWFGYIAGFVKRRAISSNLWNLFVDSQLHAGLCLAHIFAGALTADWQHFLNMFKKYCRAPLKAWDMWCCLSCNFPKNFLG